MNNWMDMDFNTTIREYEYTKRVVQKMNRVVYSKDFENKDADVIFQFLWKEMELVCFSDYLKRYLFEHCSFNVPFHLVTEKMYRDVLQKAFIDNEAPQSFSPTTKRLSATIKGWLSQDSVRRSTIFLLGFGLKMREDEVSEFLIKVNKEEDFDFYNPEEVIYWYCFHYKLPHAECRQIQQEYVKMVPDRSKVVPVAGNWMDVVKRPDFETNSRKYLYQYLYFLKTTGIPDGKQRTAYREFMRLYEHTREIIAQMYQYDSTGITIKRVWSKDDIMPGDVEKVICSGIPINENGNLQKMSASILYKHFQQKRMSRQKINDVLRGKMPVERFDLITLLFFIYSMEVEKEWPTERYLKFLEEMNRILIRSRMMELYPANPYEAFILMCLVSEEPLAVYAEIWEMSYQQE